MATLRSARRIVLIRTDRLGETILNLPLAQAIKSAYPAASLTMVVRPVLQALFHGVPVLNVVMAMPDVRAHHWLARAAQLGAWLKSKQFDVAVIANPMKEWHLAVWLARIPIRVGYNRKWGWCLSHRVSDEKALGERHEVEYNLRLLEPLGIAGGPPMAPTLPRYPESAQCIEQLFDSLGIKKNKPLVAMHPWTSNLVKQWPIDRFRSLVQRLTASSEASVIIIGGAEEQVRAAAALPEQNDHVFNLVGRLSLTELAECLRRARALVTNDSGPMHVAAAVGTPVVALFGTADPGSHPRRWGPWGSGHTVIHQPLEQISMEDVARAASAYLT